MINGLMVGVGNCSPTMAGSIPADPMRGSAECGTGLSALPDGTGSRDYRAMGETVCYS